MNDRLKCHSCEQPARITRWAHSWCWPHHDEMLEAMKIEDEIQRTVPSGKRPHAPDCCCQDCRPQDWLPQKQ